MISIDQRFEQLQWFCLHMDHLLRNVWWMNHSILNQNLNQKHETNQLTQIEKALWFPLNFYFLVNLVVLPLFLLFVFVCVFVCVCCLYCLLFVLCIWVCVWVCVWVCNVCCLVDLVDLVDFFCCYCCNLTWNLLGRSFDTICCETTQFICISSHLTSPHLIRFNKKRATQL